MILLIFPLSNDYHGGIIKKILKQVTTDSYQRIADDLNVSKETVYNLIKSLRNKLIVSPLPKKRNIDFIYIQADECYVRLQKKYLNRKNNLIMLEQITIHEGLRYVCKGRNKLINRKLYTRAYTETKEEEFYDRVNLDILASYEYKNIYLYGDGANWIKSAADALNATYITDLFHTIQAVNRLTQNQEWRQVLTKAVVTDDPQTFEIFYERILEPNNPSKYRLRNYYYLMNNWISIQRNYKLANSVGCSQEGINSHYYASRLTTRPKGFNEASARVIAQLINIKENLDDLNFQLEEQIIKPIMNKIRTKRKNYKKIYVPPQATFVASHKVLNKLNRISHPFE